MSPRRNIKHTRSSGRDRDRTAPFIPVPARHPKGRTGLFGHRVDGWSDGRTRTPEGPGAATDHAAGFGFEERDKRGKSAMPAILAGPPRGEVLRNRAGRPAVRSVIPMKPETKFP